MSDEKKKVRCILSAMLQRELGAQASLRENCPVASLTLAHVWAAEA